MYKEKKNNKNALELDCLPEPFVGDHSARVYFLNGNPGYAKVELDFASDYNYNQLVEKSLTHKIELMSGLDPLSISTN